MSRGGREEDKGMEGCGEAGAPQQRFRRSSHVGSAENRRGETCSREIHLENQGGQIVEPQSCCSSFINEGSYILLCYVTVARVYDVVRMNCKLVRPQAVENWSFTV